MLVGSERNGLPCFRSVVNRARRVDLSTSLEECSHCRTNVGSFLSLWLGSLSLWLTCVYGLESGNALAYFMCCRDDFGCRWPSRVSYTIGGSWGGIGGHRGSGVTRGHSESSRESSN